MRRLSTGLLSGLTFTLAAGVAQAQAPSSSAPVVVPGAPVIIQGMGNTPITGTMVGSPVTGQVLPYSYYAAHPAPARVYVEYGGTDQFPFHGRAYGHPGDRWSWYSMGGGDRRYLARYYYPLLP
jgi:hypothetical protein